DGRLLDCLRRAAVFGLHLVRLDIRQEAGRHAAVLDEITDFLGMGHYSDWDEAQRLDFLIRELDTPRPLLPVDHQLRPDNAGVLATGGLFGGSAAAALGS